MLHSIPDSPKRARLLEVVEMQKQLIEALCALRKGSSVGRPWIATVWPQVTDFQWLDQFWNNDKDKKTKIGARAKWCNEIAAASKVDKQTITKLMAEQLRFKELYDSPATVRLSFADWKTTAAMNAVNDLLESFYTKLFYKSLGIGYPNADGSRFFNSDYIGVGPAVCPYTDGTVQDTTLDHYLPKDQFPMLSCHPDNLIPCSTDPNKGSHKGTTTPLDRDQPDKAANWFHPRFRSAIGTYKVVFDSADLSAPRAGIVALNPANDLRIEQMTKMFGLGEFWSKALAPEIQNVAAEVCDDLKENGVLPTEPNVRAKLTRCVERKRKRIGQDALAIRTSAFYEHIITDSNLFAMVMDTCLNSVRY